MFRRTTAPIAPLPILLMIGTARVQDGALCEWDAITRRRRLRWRRGELNPRPKAFRRRPLHA